MPLETHCTVKDMAESDLLRSPAETASCCFSKGTASTSPTKQGGVFSYKGLDYIIVPSGKRFAVIILNCGKPIELQWTTQGKTRKDWSSVSWAKFSVKLFYRYWRRKKRLKWDQEGRVSLKPREVAVV